MEKTEFLKKVYRLYHQYGIKSVTMDDVAREIGVSKKTLYTWVKDKQDLVQQTMLLEEEGCGEELHAFRKTLEKSPSPLEELFLLYRMIEHYLAEFNPSLEYDLRKYYPKLFEEVVERRRGRITEGMRKNLTKGIADGYYRNDLKVELIIRMHLLNVESLRTDAGIFDGKEFPIDLIFRETFKFYIRAIVKPQYITLVDKKFQELEQQVRNK
jgi:AcrR family transcriptional regulator